MKTSALLRTGTIGLMVTALCCFTPVLVLVFGAVGLTVWVRYLDYVLMPAMLLFAGLIVYAVSRKSKTSCAENTNCQTSKGK